LPQIISLVILLFFYQTFKSDDLTLFKRGNWRELSEKMLMLIEDKALRNELAVNVRKTAEMNYSWHVVASRIKEIYSKIAT
jgi:glycosyltransferase involved in cell wall biosynthesis